MNIRTRMCMSLDGYVTTSDGWPVQLADPTFDPGQSHGFPEFQESCEAVLMGRTTFEPALGADRWPWPNLDVFVLASSRPSGTPDDVVIDSDPEGKRLTPPLGTDAELTLETERALPEGAVEIVYACS